MVHTSNNKFLPLLLGMLMLGATPLGFASRNVQQLDKDLSAVQQSLVNIEQDMSRLQRLLENRAMLELFQRMDDLAEEVSQLRGMLEQQTHDLAGLKKRQRELYLDIDRRLRDLESTASSTPVAPVIPSAPAAPATPETSGGAARPELNTPAPQPFDDTQPVPAAKPASIVAPGKPSQPVSEERAAYQKAFDMLKEGRYTMANASFRKFLGDYPNSSYAGNAQYWLGESNYVTRQFEQAVTEFQSVLKDYPASNKVPDAMLKLGYTYYELRQFTQAKDILTQLRQLFSKSTAARLAGKRLARMTKEGHI